MGSLLIVFYPSLENVEWFLYVTDPTNLELYVYPKHVDLEACCDSVTITTMACKSMLCSASVCAC